MASGSGVLGKLLLIFNVIFPPKYRFPETCTMKGEKLKILVGKADPDMNVIKAFEDSEQKLGEGGFGLVKKIKWGETPYRFAAVKKIKFNADIAFEIGRELYILNKFSGNDFTTKLLACVQTDDELYLVMNVIYGKSLEEWDNQKIIRSMLPSQTFALFLQGYKALEYLFINGIVHNDIKPDNVLINKEMDKLYLADFGLAGFAEIVEKKLGGTQGYISPGRFNKGYKFTVLDDMYSWTMSIAEILGGEKRLFGSFVSIHGLYKSGKRHVCFKKRSTECRDKLTKIVSEIFRDAGYGQYDDNEKKIVEMNLTTLLTNIIHFDYFNSAIENKDYFGQDLMQALDRNMEVLKTFWAKEFSSTSNEWIVKMADHYSLVFDPKQIYEGTERQFWKRYYKNLYLRQETSQLIRV